MKKVLYIFLTLSIISVGCSDDDDTVQPTTNLDSNLFDKITVGSVVKFVNQDNFNVKEPGLIDSL